LEVISFSQASPVVVSAIGRELGIDNKTAENYLTILEDLLLACRLPVFAKHAKREMYKGAKFFLFDTGIYRAMRPKGPLDTPELIDGAALETLLFQELRALNDYYELGFQFFYWRTRRHQEIDLVMYGDKGLFAFEVKRATTIRDRDIAALRIFLSDYRMAKAFVFYGGTRRMFIDQIEIVPFEEGLRGIKDSIATTQKA
jgi:predicted AAA+ superfamily ATPase